MVSPLSVIATAKQTAHMFQTQDNNYIIYLDANNLYGWAMSQPLPTHDFAWLTENEIQDLDVMAVADGG